MIFEPSDLSSGGLIGGCFIESLNLEIELHGNDGTYTSYKTIEVRALRGLGDGAYVGFMAGADNCLVAHSGRHTLLFTPGVPGKIDATVAQLSQIARALFAAAA